MKYKLKMTEEQVLERAIAMVKYAKILQRRRVFSRGCQPHQDGVFVQGARGGHQGGATVVNIPDTVGYVAPRNWQADKGIKENVRASKK